MTTFYFVTESGWYKRTIFQIGNRVHIGCFTGTYKQAERAIRSHYAGLALDAYLEKLNLLKAGGESWDKYPWDKHSDYVTKHCPDKLACAAWKGCLVRKP